MADPEASVPEKPRSQHAGHNTPSQQEREARARDIDAWSSTEQLLSDPLAGARREATRALIARNAEMRRRIREQAMTHSRTDANIHDEKAGVARREKVAASAARRAAREAALRASNAEMQLRIRTTRSRTEHRTSNGGAGGKPRTPRSARGASSAAKPHSARGAASAAALTNPLGGGRANLTRRYNNYDSRGTVSPSSLGGSLRAVATPVALSGGDDGDVKVAEAAAVSSAAPSTEAAVDYASSSNAEAAEVDHLRTLFQRSMNVDGHAPIGEENASSRYFAASAIKMNPRGGFSANPTVPNWDPRPHRVVPYELRGLRPVVTKEPWATPPVREAWAQRDRLRESTGEEPRIETYVSSACARI
jgi:hypothetical protein